MNILTWKYKKQQILILFFLSIIMAMFTVNIYKQIDMPRDDAYISYVYAKNMLQGHGIVYNSGEFVEGYTNFLWVFILGCLGKVGFDIPTTAQNISIILSILIIFLVFSISENLIKDERYKWLSIFPPYMLTLNPSFTYWTIYALETNLLLILLIINFATLYYIFQKKEFSTILILASSFLLFLLSIVRFDAVLLSCLLIFGFILRDFLNKNNQLSYYFSFVKIITVFVTLYSLYTFWRWSYYGDILPNTFYAKAGFGFFDLVTIERGILYVAKGLVNSWVNSTLLAYLVLAFTLYQLVDKKHLYIIPLLLIVLFFPVYVVVVGGDNLGFYRFLLPSIIFSYVAFVLFIANTLPSYFSTADYIYKVPSIIFICVSLNLHLLATYYDNDWYRNQSVQHWRQKIGESIHQHTPQSTTIAIIPAGIIKYYAERYAIDILGLNDRVIAYTDMKGKRGKPGHEKYNGLSVIARQPDLIFTQHPKKVQDIKGLLSWANHETKSWSSHNALVDLVSQKNISENYIVGFFGGRIGVLVNKKYLKDNPMLIETKTLQLKKDKK